MHVAEEQRLRPQFSGPDPVTPRAPAPEIEHLLRRAGFGARADELEFYGEMSIPQAVDYLVNYEQVPDDVDSKIGTLGYAGITTRAPGFLPVSSIVDARQRWLFRMVHTNRPLQEKMTLFWHNHFATGYNKIAGIYGNTEGARYLAAKASEDPGNVRGQVEMLRDNALGNFRDMLVNIAKDTAMLVWLDGRTNTRAKPQENFGREIMELFTRGVGYYTESDVYAAARVFTGWNLARPGTGTAQHYEYLYVAGQHDTGEKTFSFPIYSNGSRTIPARAAAAGEQDGIDLINALAGAPETARYLAKKLYWFFVSDTRAPAQSFVDSIANVYLQSRYDMRAVMRAVLLSTEFWEPRAYFARYAWPVEFIVRAMKDVGWRGFSVDTARTSMSAMGMDLYEPPDVAGWDAGETWFSTGAMLSRMNFASGLAANQRNNLVTAARPNAGTPERLVSFFLNEMRTAPLAGGVQQDLVDYLRATGNWTGSDAQLNQKAPALAHLITGSVEYQFV